MAKETQSPTLPIDHDGFGSTAPRIVIAPYYKDPTTKAIYLHQDLVKVQEPWAEEAHIAPMNVRESFGDVESFVAYVKRYGSLARALLTWNSSGLRAILDYAEDSDFNPGRCQWRAELPFVFSHQWATWRAFANGAAWSQKATVERLEDLATDIVEPSQADLLALLRTLRGTVSAKADTELRPDGTTKVSFERDSTVKTAGSVELPSSFAIAIPVLKGHVDADGRPVVYKLDVRLRVSLDSEAKLTLRLSLPNAERVLEAVYTDRVTAAKALLGESFSLLRASD